MRERKAESNKQPACGRQVSRATGSKKFMLRISVSLKTYNTQK
jgi:hypothetical protein